MQRAMGVTVMIVLGIACAGHLSSASAATDPTTSAPDVEGFTAEHTDSSHGVDGGQPIVDQADAASHNDPTANSTLSKLGLSLLIQRLASAPRDNVMLSPTSVGAALGLLAQGARGEAATALAKVFGLSLPEDAALLEKVGDGLKALKDATGENIQFSSANALYHSPDLMPLASFVERAEEGFGAMIQSVDFASPETLGEINQWFKGETGGKIPELLTDLSPSTRFLIGNALYFKGTWLHPFDPSKTRPLPFVATTGKRDVPSLHDERPLHYAQKPGYQAVQIPFAGERFVLTVLLPDRESNPEAVLKSFTPESFAESLSFVSARTQPVQLRLPKFDLTDGGEYRETLEAIGLAPIFAADADFGGMANEPLTVSSVVHKTTFTVDEEGAEASAATAIIGVRSAAPMAAPVDFTVDRPFIAALVDRASGGAVMLAVISEP
ncbi:serpin family protein [Polycyclovorans algicola]|uniref:serpin family protein n=1 Tax=Polycyclovorans algicola TaxID=616992 RepID=UPI0013777BF3|nr:serpin family protein [Polycyclovorans algicola]